jgi:hypothetical protein
MQVPQEQPVASNLQLDEPCGWWHKFGSWSFGTIKGLEQRKIDFGPGLQTDKTARKEGNSPFAALPESHMLFGTLKA